MDFGEDLIYCLCLGVKSRALVLNAMVENLDALKWWWLGVFIASTTKMTVGEAVCRWAHRTVTVHCPVRLLSPALTLRELSAHCSVHCSLLQTTVGAVAEREMCLWAISIIFW